MFGGIASTFCMKSRKALAQRIGVEIARADHVEPRGLQGLRDQTGVIGGGRERRLRIVAVADHQRDALFLLLRSTGAQGTVC